MSNKRRPKSRPVSKDADSGFNYENEINELHIPSNNGHTGPGKSFLSLLKNLRILHKSFSLSFHSHIPLLLFQ